MAVEIRQEHDLPSPVERVWNALNGAEELGKWAQTTDFRPEVSDDATPNPGGDGA